MRGAAEVKHTQYLPGIKSMVPLIGNFPLLPLHTGVRTTWKWKAADLGTTQTRQLLHGRGTPSRRQEKSDQQISFPSLFLRQIHPRTESEAGITVALKEGTYFNQAPQPPTYSSTHGDNKSKSVSISLCHAFILGLLRDPHVQHHNVSGTVPKSPRLPFHPWQ